MELYAKVRYAVRIEGLSERAAARRFGIDPRTVSKMLAFRDHLRANDEDRELYERTKRELAAREWEYVQNYADAKTDVVNEIVARATGEA